MTWELILFLAATIQGILFSVFLISVRRTPRRTYLGLYLLAFSLTILFYILYWSDNLGIPFVLRWILSSASWFMPAFLLFFFQAPTKKQLLLHMSGLVLLSLWVVFLRIFDASDAVIRASIMIQPPLKIAILILYGVWIMSVAKKHLTVEKLLIAGYASFCIGLIMYHLSIQMGFYTLKLDYIICAFFVLLIYGISYLNQLSFLKESIELRKYATSSLTEEEGKELIQRIRHKLKMSEPYKSPDFDLAKLAKLMNLPKYRISQALNTCSNQSFTELINSYRIEDAKKFLECEDTAHWKLEAIGEAAGFRNKVSFYKHFKDQTGMSPGQYRDNLLKLSHTPPIIQ